MKNWFLEVTVSSVFSSLKSALTSLFNGPTDLCFIKETISFKQHQQQQQHNKSNQTNKNNNKNNNSNKDDDFGNALGYNGDENSIFSVTWLKKNNNDCHVYSRHETEEDEMNSSSDEDGLNNNDDYQEYELYSS
ncbi:hypothetical protein ACTFIV_006562 [Dictyostelium citrinum]